jgi:hypothetical protein
LIAREDIEEEEVICEYVGEVKVKSLESQR